MIIYIVLDSSQKYQFVTIIHTGQKSKLVMMFFVQKVYIMIFQSFPKLSLANIKIFNIFSCYLTTSIYIFFISKLSMLIFKNSIVSIYSLQCFKQQQQFKKKMTISFIVMVLCIVSLIFSFQIESNAHREAYGINIGSNSYRAIIIRENMKFIENHNQKQDSAFKLYPYSQFIGLTNNEAKALYFMKPTSLETLSSFYSGIRVQTPKLQKKLKATYIDLSSVYGTPVQNQGSCGNCFAFASTDSVNMVNKASGKNYPILSAQHLTDCTKGSLGNNGCQGGWLYGSLQYQRAYGIYSNATYPLNNQTFSLGLQQSCKTVAGATKYFIKNWYYFIGTDFTSRINYLLQGYTISIAIAGGNDYFKYYKSGVLSDCVGITKIDHAVVLVGAYYNPNDLKSSYFKIKNSWGISWGQSGYIRISLGKKACLAGEYGAFASF